MEEFYCKTCEENCPNWEADDGYGDESSLSSFCQTCAHDAVCVDDENEGDDDGKEYVELQDILECAAIEVSECALLTIERVQNYIISYIKKEEKLTLSCSSSLLFLLL